MQTRRQEILTILKQQGEATVDELAQTLDLTPVTVRHHLDILRADGLVETSAVRRRRGPGRPQYVYTLTDDAGSHFPKRYAGLANELLDEIKTQLGDQGLHEILDNIADRRLSLAPALSSDLPIEDRLAALTTYMTDQGYIATWERKDEDWYIHASNCPYQRVSTRHPEVCTVDLFLCQQLSGAKMVRIQSIAQGAHSCIYQVIAESESTS